MNLDDFRGESVKLDSQYNKLIEENKEIIKKYKKYFDKLDITRATDLIYKYF